MPVGSCLSTSKCRATGICGHRGYSQTISDSAPNYRGNAERKTNMNKADLVKEVAKVTETKAKAQEAVDCVFSAITEALAKGDSVSLVGFGTFKVSDRAARTGRNPQTGEAINIPASKAPRFVPGKALKDAVN